MLRRFVENANIETWLINITKDANKLIYANLMNFCFFNHTVFFHSVIIFIISIMSVSDCCCHFIFFRLLDGYCLSIRPHHTKHINYFVLHFSHFSYLKFSILIKMTARQRQTKGEREETRIALMNDYFINIFRNVCIWNFLC